MDIFRLVVENIFTISVAIGCGAISWGLYWYKFLSAGYLNGDQQKMLPAEPSYRFRKRDRMMYYGRKWIGKVKSAVTIGDRRQKMRKRDRMLRFASRFFHRPRDSTVRSIRHPPDAFLEADTPPVVDDTLAEIMKMLRTVRLFGHFELPFFLDVCRHIETKYFTAGQYVFQDGRVDNCIYMVQSGKISLFIKGGKNDFEVKTIEKGESLYSSLSLLDMIKGNSRPLKGVYAKAVVDSIVLELKSTVFSAIFDKYLDSWVCTIQTILVRFQRVTLPALYTCIGCASDLIYEKVGSHEEHCSLNSRQSAASSSSSNCKDSSLTGAVHNVAVPNRSTDSVQTVSELNKVSASKMLASLLELDDVNVIISKVSMHFYTAGSIIIEEGAQNCCLMYVYSGSVALHRTGETVVAAILDCGELLGGLSVLTGEPSFFNVCANTDVQIAWINGDDVYGIIRCCPRMALNIAIRTLKIFSDFVRKADLALDWEICESGKSLYRQGDPADSFYMVISGRLRSVLAKNQGVKIVTSEYGRGDIVSLVEVLSDQPRSTSVMAIRDTELSKLQAGLMDLIKHQYPQVLSHIIRLCSRCMMEHKQASNSAVYREPLAHVANLNTIAIVGVCSNVPLTGFTVELWHSLKAIKPTYVLTSARLLSDLGPNALENVNKYQLINWLSRLEDTYPIVLYQCDMDMTRWTSLCIRRADCILIVANGADEPMVGVIEQQLEQLAVRAQKELILLWDESTEYPRRTAEWLDLRGWVSSHYHIRFRSPVFKQRRADRLLYLMKKIANRPYKLHSDISRLARSLTSTSVGLILGGGGARGAAHVGAIKALKELGIPVDIVGGVSIGAFIGGIYCMNDQFSAVAMQAKESFQSASSFWSRLIDLTYPHSAMFTGNSLNRLLQSVFSDVQIEDLWLPYFNITTDITASEMRIHRSGKLWRYARASMSYIGLSPPLCDPVDGHYLVDGCYMNNLPADVMKNFGAETVIAVDVGAATETNFTNYGDSLSGWWVLWNRLNPWADQFRVMNMAEIQSRLAYVSCVRQLEQVKKAPYCKYIRPSIDQFQTLDFKRFDEILEIGYRCSKTVLENWMSSAEYTALFAGSLANNIDSRRPEHGLELGFASAQSFTDLAAMVTRIEPYCVDSIEHVSEMDSDSDEAVAQTE